MVSRSLKVNDRVQTRYSTQAAWTTFADQLLLLRPAIFICTQYTSTLTFNLTMRYLLEMNFDEQLNCLFTDCSRHDIDEYD